MTEKSQTYVSHLIASILPKCPEIEHGSFESFAQQMLQHLSSETLEIFSKESWENLLFQGWDFYKKTSPAEGAQVQCGLGDFKGPQGLFQATTLMMCNKNIPFLVDSFQSLLSRSGYSFFFIAHPVFSVKRDDKGHLLSLHMRQENIQDGMEESLIFCVLHEALTAPETLELEQKTHRVLEKVTRVVDDWPFMQAKAQELVRSLEKTSPKTEEIQAFFYWISQGHFTFLGYNRYRLLPSGNLELDPDVEPLGLLKNKRKESLPLLFEGVLETDAGRHLLQVKKPGYIITKASRRSPVQRPEFMDAIGLKIYGETGEVVAVHHFLGLFTARASTQSARDIPLVRQKVVGVLKACGLDPTWHDGKRVIHILETLPRDELFQSSQEDLLNLCLLGLEFQETRNPVRLSLRMDPFKRYISCFALIARDHYRAGLRLQIANLLAHFFDGTLITSHVHLESLPFAWVHCLIHLNKDHPPEFSLSELEDKLTKLALTWDDRFKDAWIQTLGAKQGRLMHEQSQGVFPKGYEDARSPEEGLIDFKVLCETIKAGEIRLSLTQDAVDRPLHITIYTAQKSLLLSHMISIFENLGLRVMTESAFPVYLKTGEVGYIHLIATEPSFIQLPADAQLLIGEAFKAIWTTEAENDSLNRLVLKAGLSWRECIIFRAYTRYLKQIQVPYSQQFIEETLVKHADILRGFLHLFHGRFDPLMASQRDSLQAQEMASLQTLLLSVTHLNEAQVLQYFLNLIQSTLRTNFYQRLSSGLPKAYLSFKFDCSLVMDLPKPKPLYEIFVYSPRVEGVHLRGGKIARGGLRWSDRQEDYRVEILDLMKTQMIKNTVTVPVGSKGGFILKQVTSPEMREQEASECYEMFVRGLLDLTDNREGTQIVPPPAMIPWDGDDPYLVVAADKGTANRSNAANSLSKAYHFWLSDAFASGGSHGYNHKEMAITSRGVWKSVEHHFMGLGLNPQTTPFTVVGMGDMSGDVFGNGMLLSRQIQLVAAFDHRHIFLDPNPDPETSYTERLRLFTLPKSSWADYNPALLSEGGGIFSRDLRTIPLTPAIRERLQISEEALPPEALQRAILKTPVDLLFFGGIGTYVKASSESNLDAADRANDALRINGKDIRARVVAEGANLGCTQKGRIEYALSGGHINTDALDNSAGVDCSDHEVNLKILFEELIRQGVLTSDQRNDLLSSMTQEVADLVLANNYWQNQAVALAFSKGFQLFEEHGRLLRTLEASGILDRTIEDLPSDDELQQRHALRLGLTRPELSVLLAYSKIDLAQKIGDSSILDDPAFNRVLLKYFPRILSEKFPEACLNHPLRRGIIGTLATNIVVNTLGPSFVNEICELTGCSASNVVKALWVVRKVLRVKAFEDACFDIPNPELQKQILWAMDKTMKRLVIWLLAHEQLSDSIQTIVDRYINGFEDLRTHSLNHLPKAYLEGLDTPWSLFSDTELPADLRHRLLTLDPLSIAPDLIQIAHTVKKPLHHVTSLYYAVGESLGLRWAQETTRNLPIESPWQKKAFRELQEQMRLIQKHLTSHILSSYPTKTFDPQVIIDRWAFEHTVSFDRYRGILEDVQRTPFTDLAPFVVLARELERLYEKTVGMCMMTASYG